MHSVVYSKRTAFRNEMFLSPIVSCSPLQYRPLTEKIVVVDDVIGHEFRDNDDGFVMTRSLPRSSTVKRLLQETTSPHHVTHQALLPVGSPPPLFDCNISYIRLTPPVSTNDAPMTKSTCLYPGSGCCAPDNDVIDCTNASPMLQCSPSGKTIEYPYVVLTMYAVLSFC